MTQLFAGGGLENLGLGRRHERDRCCRSENNEEERTKAKAIFFKKTRMRNSVEQPKGAGLRLGSVRRGWA